MCKPISLWKDGNEDNHLEMRARIVCELVIHAEQYLDNQYLIGGADTDGKTNIAKMFAMFSDHYNNEQLTDVAIQRILRKEVVNICASGRYMGIWQIGALANILEKIVVSVYLLYDGYTVRNFLNRTFIPVQQNEIRGNQVYVTWSNFKGRNIPETEWRPNHVVPLKTNTDNERLYIFADSETEALSPLMGFDVDDDHDSGDSIFHCSFLNSIIERLDNVSEEVSLIGCYTSPDQISGNLSLV